MNVEKLKQLKKDAGYTNKMIADESGVPLGTVQKIFSGETKAPRFKTLKAIEGILISASGYEEELQLAAAKLQENRQIMDAAPDVVSEVDVVTNAADDVADTVSDNSDIAGAEEVQDIVNEAELDADQPQKKETPAVSKKQNSMLRELMAGDIIFEIRQYMKESGRPAYITGPGIKVVMPVTQGSFESRNDAMVCFPDVAMVTDRAKITAGGINGAPDLIIELMDSETRSNNLGTRPDALKNAGVKEYWMIDIDAKNIMVYDFEEQALPTMYGFSGRVPVSTAGDGCEVNFAQLYGHVGFLF